MITIGITFCDRDYKYYDRLIEQLKERVHVPYELVIIDNTEDGKLGDKATYAFGHNAYQFAARYKIIKLAKGDYIWFIDGDDEIIGLDELPSDADIISYGIWTEGAQDTSESTRYTTDLSKWEFIDGVLCRALWNKLIKTTLFSTIDFYVDDPLLKVVSLEDCFYLCVALKRAKTVDVYYNKCIYKHNHGISNICSCTNEEFDELVTGHSEILKLLAKVYCDMPSLEEHQFKYLCLCIPASGNSFHIIHKLMDMYPIQQYWAEQYENIVNMTPTDAEYHTFRKHFIQLFGLTAIPKRKYTNVMEDGTVHTVYFEIKRPEEKDDC